MDEVKKDKIRLSAPFSFRHRQVLFKDRIWYVPDFLSNYDSFIFPGWEHPDWFANTHPVNVEYCSGNGAWIIEKARKYPDENWVAVEKQFARVCKIWAKLNADSLKNLMIVCGDGRLVTSHYFKDASISQVYINFPDPWPKLKHVKNRIFQPAFVKELVRVLLPLGRMTFVTDDKKTSERMLKEAFACGGISSCFPDPYFTENVEDYGASFFEQLFRQQGKKIRYHQFVKN